MTLDASTRAAMLAPQAATAQLPGIGGRLRQRHEDFLVDEIAAYPADGREQRHLLVRFEKRGLPTMAAVKEIAQACGIGLREVGVAGRKDAVAVTRQWISLPADVAPALDRFAHPAIVILDARPHGQKLRTGHLHGNRFEIVVRDLAVPVDEALQRVGAKLRLLGEQGGLENLYGPQRFGAGGANLERGLNLLAAGRLDRRDSFVASAAQSGLFNLYVGLRRERGWLRALLPGDLLRKRASGGLFYVDDVGTEQARLDRGEVELTGPIHGAKMRRPPEQTASALLEEEVLRRAGLDLEQLRVHGKRLPGSRRVVQLDLGAVEVDEAAAEAQLGAGLRLRFVLPSGSFATQLTRELQVGPDTADPLQALGSDDPEHGSELP